MNKSILSGRFTADPELSKTGETTIAKWTLAVNRKIKKEGQPDADFIRCTAFGKTAENIGKFFSKGRPILIEGHIQTGSYEKDGVKHYTTDIIVETFDFMDSKSNTDSAAEPTPSAVGEGFVNVPDNVTEEELPFA